MDFSVDEINHIRVENPNSLTAQSFMLLKKWVSRDGKNATSKFLHYFLLLDSKQLGMLQTSYLKLHRDATHAL